MMNLWPAPTIAAGKYLKENAGLQPWMHRRQLCNLATVSRNGEHVFLISAKKGVPEAVYVPTSENLGSGIVKLQILTRLELKWSDACDSFGALRSCC